MNKKLKKILRKPSLIFLTLGHRGFFNWMDDAAYLKIAFRIKKGKKLDLKNPRSLNEKLQWLKIHDRREIYTTLVDKYEVRNYIAEKIGKEYLIPLLGVWDSFDDIEFEKLPQKFVLKCTHDSGSVYICKDKSKIDMEEARKVVGHSLRHNYYDGSREWAYKSVKPRIIAEEYMVDESGWELKDYKIFCFNGIPDYVEVDFNRPVQHKLNPYSLEWEFLGFCDDSPNDINADIKKPERLDDMIEIAKTLSEGFPFLRVDFYSIGSKIYCGELTLCPGSGFIAFNPEYIDEQLGEKLKLPSYD